MEIEFDPDKNEANKGKHAVALSFAAQILMDAERLDILDVRFDYAEERFVTYGRVEGRVWVCVFTRRGDIHRIISVRKANDRETKRYRDTPR
ncbi:BrnT family toxin [Varunaivibrio sulfuroxidans]|nr:BrnT family toxin [Varunaivibrio sulfuroxidans]WES31758.1 BrnT family toxin [Varunaivibrio sulfuroxidans]